MYIEAFQQLDKGKVRICLDNGTDFTLYKAEALKYNLAENKELDEITYSRIVADILVPRCKKRGLHLLEKQDRSISNLREKLLEGGYPSVVVDEAIEYITSFGYLNDERMARAHIRFYQSSRSKFRIKQDLLHKGISSELIDICIEDEYTVDETELARHLADKRGFDVNSSTYDDKVKMYRFLAGKGFSSDVINNALH